MSYTARSDAAWRLAKGVASPVAQYWPTLTVKVSPPVGTRTSNQGASQATLPKGLCAERAMCALPQVQLPTSAP